MQPTTSGKRRQTESDDQGQRPSKSRKMESPQPTSNVVMSDGEAGPSPDDNPRFATVEFVDVPGPAMNVQEEDLVVLNTLFEDPFLELSLRWQRVEHLITVLREHFKKNVDLASRLEIPLTNFESTDSQYEATKSSEALQSALFAALSSVAEDPKVQTWKAVFSHSLFRHQRVLDYPSSSEEEDQMEATHRSWYMKYVDNNHHLLWKHMEDYCSEPEKVYAFYSPIIQSSGMGKSRLVDRMSEEHLVIQCCLRKARAGYPPPDNDARDFLIQEVGRRSEYHRHVQAFLISLLQHTRRILESKYQDGSTPGEAAVARFMHDLFEKGMSSMNHGDNRYNFYKAIVISAEKILQRRARTTEPSDQTPSPEDLPRIADDFLNYLSRLFETERNGPLLTLAWDEAHVLIGDTPRYSDWPLNWTYFNEFRRVLKDCDRTGRLFSLFLSTDAKIDQFTPNSRNDPYASIEERKLVVPHPFINLDFDQCAERIVNSAKGFSLSEAVQPKWIVRFGRPLWHTRYHYGNSWVKTCIFSFAITKLLCEQPDPNMPLTREVILAIMGIRLGLKLRAQIKSEETKSDMYVARAVVERHMGVIMWLSPSSQTLVSSASSEPVLAEASIRLMRLLKRFRPAQALKQILTDPLQEKGRRGVFIVALLLLLARDAAEQKIESSKIPVTTFLKKLLGDNVLNYQPSISKPGKEDMTLEAAFNNAYVNFTHAVVVQDETGLGKENAWLAMARGAFCVCPTGRWGVDVVIPVVMGDKVKGSTVTAILVRFFNDTADQSQCDKVFRGDPADIGFLSADEELDRFEHPFIRIFMALQESEDEGDEVMQHYIVPPERNDYTTYDIVCRGLTHSTYKVIEKRDEDDWEECRTFLGGYREYFKHPDGRYMSYDEAKVRSRLLVGIESPCWIQDA